MMFTSNGDKYWPIQFTSQPFCVSGQTNKNEATRIYDVSNQGFTLDNNGGTPEKQWIIAVGY